MPYIGNPIYQSAYIPLTVPKTVEEANALFEYRDGVLFWKTNRGYSKVMNKPVGSKTASGYFESKINKKSFKVHRMVFLMHHGYLPKIVDHIDGNRANNAIENLREATSVQNKYNQKVYKSNQSGAKGVMWDKKYKKWRTQINYNGKRKCLGSFSNFNEACEFIDLARTMVHGDFARTA